MIRWCLGVGLVLAAGMARGGDLTLDLLNGDRLSGGFLGMEGSRVLLDPEWRSEPLRVHGRYLRSSRFTPDGTVEEFPWIVELENGDRFGAELLGVTGQGIRVRTCWSEEVVVRRTYARGLERNPLAEGSADRMLASRDRWLYHDGRTRALESEPDLVSVSGGDWDLKKSGVYMRRTRAVSPGRNSMVLEMESSGSSALNGIHLEINGYSTPQDQFRTWKLRFLDDVLQTEFYDHHQPVLRVAAGVEMPPDGVLRLAFTVDAVKGVLECTLNGERVASVDSSGWEFYPEPREMDFRMKLGPGSPELRLRELYVLELPATGRPSLPSGDVRPNRILFRNGDWMEGRLRWVNSDGQAGLEPPSGGELVLPLARVERAVLDAPLETRIRRRPAHVRLWMGDGSDRMLVELLGASATEFRFRREGIDGEQRVAVSRVRRVEWNPYFERSPEELPVLRMEADPRPLQFRF